MEFAQAATTTAVKIETGIMHAIMSASPVVQLTLIILVLLSVLSWKIIFSKSKLLKDTAKADEEFLDSFWEAGSMESAFREVKHYENSSAARIFKTGYMELQKIADSKLAKTESGSSQLVLTGIDNIARSLRKAHEAEMRYLESSLNILATIGSTGPFIGLFGTVWGIMNAFQKIGETGAASLAVVAPGISEALVATAIGLLAAIPAVIAYNNFNTKISEIEVDLNSFNSDFLNVVKRNFFQD